MELKALHAAGFGVPLGEIFAHLIHMIANVIQQDVGCAHRTAPHRTAPHTYDHLTTYIPFIRIFIKTEWAYCRCHSELLW